MGFVGIVVVVVVVVGVGGGRLVMLRDGAGAVAGWDQCKPACIITRRVPGWFIDPGK
jgi:hypothetical protein